MKYHHLSFEERFAIEKMYCGGFAIRKIAQFLKRSVNTISREIRKHSVNGEYDAVKAKQKSSAQRMESEATMFESSNEQFSHCFG